MSCMWNITTLLLVLPLVCEVAVYDFNRGEYLFGSYIDDDFGEPHKFVADEEYIRHIHSMINAYRGDMGGRYVIETNALIDTKFRAWKRNADLINSMLALPKGLNEAGR